MGKMVYRIYNRNQCLYRTFHIRRASQTPPISLPLVTGPFNSFRLTILSPWRNIQPVQQIGTTKIKHTQEPSLPSQVPSTPGWRETILIKHLAQVLRRGLEPILLIRNTRA